MSFNQIGIDNGLEPTKKTFNDSRTATNHTVDLEGKTVAEMEVAAFDSYAMLIGTCADSEQPYGFCVEYNYDIDKPELVTTEVITRRVAEGSQYLLQIANSTNKALCAEIRVL